jgi:hypothetical protein
MWILSAALFNYFFSVFPNRSPIDRRLPGSNLFCWLGKRIIRSLEKLERLVPQLVIFRWDMRAGLGSPKVCNGPNY